LSRSASAFCAASQAGAAASGTIGTLMLGPSTSGWPHQQMAQSGSALTASAKAWPAAWWLKP
jgi:hypothetical protein